MTLRERICHTAATRTSIRLSADDCELLRTLMFWADCVLEDINAEQGETHGGNAIVGALDEED